MRPLRILMTAALLPCLGAADTAPGFAESLSRSPQVAAERARLRAAERSVALAGVLPDPMVGLEAGRTRGPGDEDMDMLGVMVEQPLPRWGERDARRAAAAAAVQVAAAEAAMVLGDHAADLAMLLAEHRAASAARIVVAELSGRLATAQALQTARAGTGEGLEGRLMLASRLQALEVEAADLDRRMADAEADIRGRLALAPGATLPEPAWPDPAALRPERSPLALRAAAQVAEAEAMAAEAAARGRPETAVGIGWEGDGIGSDMRSDQVTLRLTVSVPVWRDAYADGVAAADGRRRAAEHAAHGARRMVAAAVAIAVRAATQAALAEAAATAEAGRLATLGETAVRRIAAGGAEAGQWLDLLDRAAEARRMAIEAALMRDRARADLWRHAPPLLDQP